jgi:allantoinase
MNPIAPIDLAVRSRRVVVPGEDEVQPRAILIAGGRISAVVTPDAVPAGVPVDDLGDLVVMPGLVDIHVHINEPGRTDWEGFRTATRAAAAGGVTTLVDMPLNSSPVTTTVAALEQKLAAAEGQLWVDVGFHGGVVPGNAEHLRPLADAGVLGFKAFLCHSGIDEFPNTTEADLRAAMPVIRDADRPLLVHAELVSPLPVAVTRAFAENPRSYGAYLATRPPEWEVEAIELMVRLCRETRCPVHIVHLATGCRRVIADAKGEGLPLTVETCPHYLFFEAESVPDGDTRFKCAPPIRGRETRKLLWDFVGTEIDTIGSDHSPAPPQTKELATGNLAKAWGGISSIQLTLPILATVMTRDRIPMELIGEWAAANPAAVVRLSDCKGSIAPGRDADLCVFDPDAEFTVTPEMLHTRHKITPYEGRTLRGKVMRTYLRGRVVYDDGKLVDAPTGRTILRKG